MDLHAKADYDDITVGVVEAIEDVLSGLQSG